MFVARTAVTAARRAAFVAPVVRRGFTTTMLRRDAGKKVTAYKSLNEVKEASDLIGPGAAAGTVPTDLEQATGLERLELLGKIEGVDVFDMKPLDSSRRGTMENPIIVKSAGEEQYVGCTGSPADSHVVVWLGMSRDRPIERCPECGSVYKMLYIGPEDDHHHQHHGPEEPKTLADYVKPEYYYT
ncbi:hypothetical protein SAPIO_CDS2056 [Scedosporium apiospermum]|uniref:Cytochrome c oxidase subunit 4, mitochondrial n=1 Tax=Pseudallescheria apiosperma TaxID=563466 RepID=A0A084GD54_PSEDA|nr:uncharacterized protein SAPIO_CDS2056 [Scedosporium apiospermum]KEZ45266.1 hypothetical protein SAPIO_CDS2056 [Scedosporium apiospermum]